MNSITLSVQTEATLQQLTEKYFPRYVPLLQEPKDGCILAIQLIYLTLRERGSQAIYQSRRVRDNLNIDMWSQEITVSGFWRHQLLCFVYSPSKQYWHDEDGEPLPTPYPEGVEIEKFTAELWELLSPYR